MPKLSESFPFTFFFVYISHLPHACYMNFQLPRSFQIIRPIPRLCVTFRNKVGKKPIIWGVVRPPANTQTRGRTLVGCPQLLTQYIHSYPPYLQAVFSILNLRTCRSVVTGTRLISYRTNTSEYNMRRVRWSRISSKPCIVRPCVSVNLLLTIT
jgi:hypothetical protein